MKSKEQVGAIIAALKTLYPDALCSLDYEKDYELLFSVRLAAQCTDARVNLVTPALFARYPTLEAFAAAADGKATKIIIPSELQNLGGVVPSIKELLTDPKEAE